MRDHLLHSRSEARRSVHAAAQSGEIAFIDPGVSDIAVLLGGLRPDVEPIVLTRSEPAIGQMARLLADRGGLDAIHVIAHGHAGTVDFANGACSVATVGKDAGDLRGIGAALAAEGTFLLWACEAGAGESGAALVDRLAETTGARVAAASGLVGASSRGGSWFLDGEAFGRTVGAARPPLTAAGMAAYGGVMATFNGTNGNDVANATTGTLTGFSGGTVAQLQDATGDTFNGGNGADTIVAGSGNDTINLGSGQFVAGESIEGGANSASGTRDQIVLTSGGTVDLSVGTVSGIETLTGSILADTVTMTASQWAGFSTINLGLLSDTVNVVANGTISGLATPTISSVETGNLVGTAGTDTVTLSGAQLNAIIIGSGSINLGAGTGDTINLTSTSTDLNSLGANNNSIQGVEAISAAGAASGVTISLAGQSEAFSITGSNQNDVITGGTGADTILAGSGNDTVNIANGQFVAGETIQGGADSGTGTRDQVVLTGSSATVDFSFGTVSGFETFTGSSGSDTVTMTAAQWTGFGTINLGSGSADVFNVVAGGDLSALSTPTLSGAEAVNLVGTSGNDVMTVSGAQLDAMVGGSGNINLGAGTGDTINLTSTSADLNALGANNTSIQGVEAISAATATSGVTMTLGGQTEAFSLTGSAFADTITGGSGNDIVTGGAGNDVIDGGGGTSDTVVFSGARADYAVSLQGTTYTLTDNRAGSPNGTDRVTNVENFQFSDGTRTASQLNAAAATQNKIVLENQKEGNPESEWGIEGSGSANIQGFASDISVNVGGTVDFKIATDSTNYRIDIYRLGYYNGDGARKVASIQRTLGTAQVQPHPIVDMSRGLIDAGNWSVSASWQIPSDAVSGVYVAKLVREDGTEGASHIPFIVRDDTSTSDIVFQTSDTTWQAYNEWGGASLYFGQVPVDPADMVGYLPPNCGCGVNAIGRATAVSYNRPIVTNTSVAGGTHDFIFGAEHSAIRWLEQNGYDVSYISGVDTSRAGTMLLNHDAFLSVGHDEYWSAEQRANVEAARDSGVNLAFWSGNEVYWKVRWETSIDGNGTPYRTMVCYKETWGGTPDPSDVGTGTWRDPRFADPGQKPENALTGTIFQVDSYRLDTITIPYEYSNLRFWRNTDVANLQPGQTYSLVQNLLGYEWDSDVENGYRPAGLINMSLSTVTVDTYLRDYGTSIGTATATHSLTMYRAESGALVFGAGTVFWSWGLDDTHAGASTPVDPNVRQAMVNMFADMGIQPQTLDASLVLATQSTDTTKPTATVTSPTLGASFAEGQKVTITGTAQDFGGGIVAGVEVSLDGGQSWWKATGREAWSYSWVVQASGSYNIMARAVDDSLNLGTATPGIQVTVNLPDTSSLWTFSTKPQTETVLDRDGVELGVKFQATTGGLVQGIRFFKGFYNIGPHTVDLWTSTGQRLATGVSVGEGISGWQTVTFSSPVRITPGTTYVASYHTGGYYSVNDNYFTTGYNSGLLNVLPGGGVFAYSGTPGVFPTNTSNNANYWVDVVFAPDPNQAPTAGNDSGFTVGKDGTLRISFASLLANDQDPNGDPLTVSAVGNAANGTVSIDAQTGQVVFTPTAGYSGPASFTYTVSDGRNGTATANVSIDVSTNPAGVSVFQDTEGPTGPGFTDSPLELGMKFTAAVNGTVSGIRFYKLSNDTGPHTGSLWSSTGQLLATVTFTNESSSGWQTATFSNPVQIQAGVTYVASYHTSGVYAADANYFTNALTRGLLTAPASAGSGGNGVFTYSGSTAFPTSTFQAANYWVDVVFDRSTVNTVPIANNDNGFTVSNSGTLTINASALLANDTDPDFDPLSVTGVGNATNGSVNFNSQTGVITFTPTAGYIGPASFTYTISDGRNGTASANVGITVGQSGTTVNLFSPSSTPSQLAVNDPDSVELGVKFVASSAGLIYGLRFYKSAQDTGTHTGSLWTSTGTRLATATFTNESASGWQTVTFSQPISVAAGATYVASYHSNGFYAATPNFFDTAHTNGPLTAPASGTSGGNGVYAYGTGSLFPNNSFSSSNYWVDVLYEQTSGNVAPTAGDDTGYSTNLNTPITFQSSTLLANDSDANADPLTITSFGNAVNGAVTFSSQTNTFTFTPNNNYSGPASFTYTISDGNGGSDTAQVSLTVAPSQNLFSPTTTPATITVNDPNPVELGMKFQADVAGWITGFRFYKGPQNTGPHEAHLWTSTGTLLATATFTNETASGWQSVNLSQEVAIQANTTYIVSYHTNGFYSASDNFFASDFSNQHLTAPASGSSGGNGVYAYGASGLFPNNSFNASNYYVDVSFRPQLAA